MNITQKHASSLYKAMAEIPFVAMAAIISNSQDNYLLGKKIVNYSWKNVLGQ